MAKKNPRRLVIDADVARSAGTSEHPVSVACRQFLETVRDVRYQVVMTKAILQEWRRHKSEFSEEWLTQMSGEGRGVSLHDAERDKDLRRRITAAIPSDCQHAAEKDVHLIEAALNTDHLVASGDGQARRIFRSASESVRELKPIVWVNPKLSADDPICWLRNGARSEAHRQLGA